MTRCIVAELCFSILAVALAFNHKAANDARPAYEGWQCKYTTLQTFKGFSKVLASNPAGIFQMFGELRLEKDDGTICVYQENSNKHNTYLKFDKNCKPITTCCSWVERLGMGSDDDGNLLPFAADAFALTNKTVLSGVEFTHIQPDSCPTGGCPLVVEIPGNAGYPWLMARNACKGCHSLLGVVIVSPIVGAGEDTSLSWINSTFIPFVRHYLAKHTWLVDKQRVYLVTASRGNEIGLTAALLKPSMFSYVLMTGKFQFTADHWNLMQTPGIFKRSRAAGLKKIDINIGDKDPILPDEEFYANLSALVGGVSESGSNATKVVVNIYPWQAHDTAPGVWSKRSALIWAGTATP